MIEIQQNLTKVNRDVRAGRHIQYIVIHYTGNRGDTAYGNTLYFKSLNRKASAHYFVDETSVWQCVEDKDIAWHCGTKGKYYHAHCRNDNSIGIEMCNSCTRNTAVEARTAELVRQLMDKYNIGADHVIRHYDVTHKKCPAPLVNNAQWEDFKKRLEEINMEELGALQEKVGYIDDTVTRLHSKVSDIDISLSNLYAIFQGMLDTKKVYNSVEEVPEWYRPTVQKLVNKDILRGDENGRLNLTEETVRILVVNDRAGLYD